jgi:adenylyltransferase/sulfurtransferase
MLTEREKRRYARQLMLFSDEGQERLKGAEVCIAGAGGLGSPVALYLAAAGVGTITLVDNDEVELSNLNRQVLHWDRDIGRRKVVSAEEKLSGMNPYIRIKAVHTTIDKGTVDTVVGEADLIVDAMDNFPVRFLLNDAAIRKGIPFIHGAIRGFHGQVITILPGKTACLRCLFPQGAPGEVFPVVGVTPGIIAGIQANEAIKYLVGQGELLAGRLLLWDGHMSRVEEIAVERNPKCPACAIKADR